MFRKVTLVLGFLFALCMAPHSFALPPDVPDGSIVSVRIEGTKRIDSATVKAALKTDEGQKVVASRIRRDIRAIFQTGFFDDVVVQYEPVDGGVALVFVVK